MSSAGFLFFSLRSSLSSVEGVFLYITLKKSFEIKTGRYNLHVLKGEKKKTGRNNLNMLKGKKNRDGAKQFACVKGRKKEDGAKQFACVKGQKKKTKNRKGQNNYYLQ